MRIIIPDTTADAERIFGAEHDDHAAYALGHVPRGLCVRVLEIERHLRPDAVLTLARDWEGCIIGLVEGDDRVDVLAFTEHGLVAHGGVNIPTYFPSFADLLANDAQR